MGPIRQFEDIEAGDSAEFSQFLAIAKGSAGEVQARLYVALDQGHINQEQFVSIRLTASSTYTVPALAV